MSARSTADPDDVKAAAAFVVGILIGVGIVLPAVADTVNPGRLAGRLGPVGTVLVVGVTALVVLTMGIIGLYRFFGRLDT